MKSLENALIMAAGRGSRMIPLTNKIPKAMAEINGITLISSGIKKLKPSVKNIHITVGYKGSMLAKHVIENDVSSVINTNEKGNSWWIYNSLLKHLNEPVLVLTCDNIVDLNFDFIIEDYYNLNEPACMVIPVSPVEGLEGDYIFHDNYNVVELNRSKKSSSYCSGIQVINPYKINKITNYSDDFKKLWEQLIELEELKCSKIYPEKWFSVDTLKQLSYYQKSKIIND